MYNARPVSTDLDSLCQREDHEQPRAEIFCCTLAVAIGIFTQLITSASLSKDRKLFGVDPIISMHRAHNNRCDEALRCLEMEEAAYTISFHALIPSRV